MQALKAKDLVELADEELAQRLKQSREELFNLRFQHAAGQLENTSRLRQVRQDIARIMTVQSARERARESLMAEQRATRQRERQGVVVSDKMDKTIVVAGDRGASRTPSTRRSCGTTSRLKAHDEQNEARIGDTVLVRECRPLSRDKTWRLIKVLERAE